MLEVKPVTLNGKYVKLVPLGDEHIELLKETVKDGELWRLWYAKVPHPDQMESHVKWLIDTTHILPFCVINQQTGEVIGLSCYLNIDKNNLRLEIGATWYQKSAQKTACNTEAKLLLLTYAFETLNCIAVEFRTNFFNQRSRAAIERLGAKLDGVLRNHMLLENGLLRDTCVYSIIQNEWPAVKHNLNHKLELYNMAN